MGEIERPPIQINGTYYAVKNNAIASWVPCKVMEQTEGGAIAQKNVKYYRIKFLKSQHTMLKTVPAKYLAYYDPPTVRLPIGGLCFYKRKDPHAQLYKSYMFFILKVRVL